MALFNITRASDIKSLFQPGTGKYSLNKDKQYQHYRQQLNQRRIENGLNNGLSWEDISNQTGVPLQQVKSYSQQTRPNYGIQPPNALQKAESIAGQVGSGIKNEAVGVYQDIGQGIRNNLSIFSNDNPGLPEQIQAAQQKAQSLPDSIKAKAKNITPEDNIWLLGLVNQGKSVKELNTFLDQANQRKAASDKKVLGTAAEVASLGIGAPGLASAAKAGTGALVKAVAETAAGGAAGGAGSAARRNQNTKQILEQAGVGAGIGVIGAGVMAGLSKPAQAILGKFQRGEKVTPQETAQLTSEVKLLNAGPIVNSNEPPLLNAGIELPNDAAIYRNPSTTTNPTITASETPGVLSEPITPLTRAQQPTGQVVKQLQDIEAQLRDAQLNGGITADEARNLVRQRQALINQINGNTPEPVITPAELTTPINHVVQTVTQKAISDPETTLSGVAQNLTDTQSALRDSVIQQFPHLKNEIQPLTHEVHNQSELANYAKSLVNTDPEAAKQILSGGAMQHINPDAQVKIGQALTYRAAKMGDKDELNSVLHATADIGTMGGQTLRASRIDNLLNPKDIVTYAAKIADKAGNTLTDAKISQLETMAEKVGNMPSSPEKQKAILALKTAAEQPGIVKRGVNAGAKLTASFRAILASTDLSGGGRQGAVLFARYPVIGAKAEALGAKVALSPNAYKEEAQKLASLTDENGVPLNQVFNRMKLSVQAAKGESEEQFSNAALVEHLPGVGHILKGSERAYNLTLSYMRAHVAKEIIDAQGGVEAVSKNWNTAQFQALGRVIDTLSGRGRGGTPYLADRSLFEKAAPFLSTSLFSARLWKSRLDLLNPLFYGQVAKNPVALRLAIRSGLQFASTVSLVLGLAAAAGAKVETDLRSSDFGKIKVGNTRIDIMGGLQQNIVLFHRLISGQYKSSSTGNVSSLTSNLPGSLTRYDILENSVENKLSPVISEIIRQIQGKDIGGQPMNTSDRIKNVGSNFVPLAIQDVYSGIKDNKDKSIAALTAAGFFGAGASTYGPSNKDWNRSQSKQLSDFKKSTSPGVFQHANELFNQQYNSWLESINKNPRYQKLNIKDQATVRKNKQQEIEKKILGQYGFNYKAQTNLALKGF